MGRFMALTIALIVKEQSCGVGKDYPASFSSRIMYAKSADGGPHWTEPVIISEQDGEETLMQDPHIVVDSQDICTFSIIIMLMKKQGALPKMHQWSMGTIHRCRTQS